MTRGNRAVFRQLASLRHSILRQATIFQYLTAGAVIAPIHQKSRSSWGETEDQSAGERRSNVHTGWGMGSEGVTEMKTPGHLAGDELVFVAAGGLSIPCAAMPCEVAGES